MQEDGLRALETALRGQTREGLFALVGYGLEAGRIHLLTANIPDLPVAIRILRDTSGREYNLGQYLPLDDVRRASQENPHFLHYKSYEIPGLDFSESSLRAVGSLVVAFGAPFYSHKAVGVVDICGFSTVPPFSQLAYLYSLENLFRSNAKRCRCFTSELHLSSDFGHASTGDGFYFWHEMHGGGADVATLLLLLCMMSQVERFREEDHFPMQLKAAMVIDSVFMLYDSDRVRFAQDQTNPQEWTVHRGEATNVVGVATNIAARLIAAARPSQILIAQFKRSGQGQETMTPHSLIAQAAQLFRHEGNPAEILFDPNHRLCVTDKHKMRWHCWNVVGRIPNRMKGAVKLQRVGLKTDDAYPIETSAFNSEPWGRHELDG